MAQTDNLRQKQLEYNNLEIRGTWTGDTKEPVDLQISLEVNTSTTTVVNCRSNFSPGPLLTNPWSLPYRSKRFQTHNYNY